MKAFDVKNSKGRLNSPINSSLYGISDPYKSDYYALSMSQASKRMMHKSQVVHYPLNPHFRNRKSHTEGVVAISGIIANLLGLNVSLCEAIAAGHDIGQAPFGYHGEKFLSEVSGKKYNHPNFGLVVAQIIENLNLTYETLEGMSLHSLGKNMTCIYDNKPHEYAVVANADKIDYLTADIEDAISSGKHFLNDVPKIKALGSTLDERRTNCIRALVLESKEKGFISFKDSDVAKQLKAVRDYMYGEIYKENPEPKITLMMEQVYNFFDSSKIKIDPAIVFSLLTDNEVMHMYNRIKENKNYDEVIDGLGIQETLKSISGKNITFTYDLSQRDNKKKR